MRFLKRTFSLLPILSKYAKAMMMSTVVRIGTKWYTSQATILHTRSFGDEHWEGDYQELRDMTEQKSYEYHIQIALAALKGRGVPLQEIQLTYLTLPEDPPSGSPL
ncbi:hypothetical protein AFGD_000406 [Aspergillus flavus]|nr:hypothetical protein AFGD_000406 [Aspergillus flavus]